MISFPVDDTLRQLVLRTRLVAFDFDGVFTDNAVWVMQDGTELVRCWRSDGLGLQQLGRLGLEVVVVSTETNPVVTARCRKLGLRCAQGCKDKLAALQTVAAEEQVPLECVAFVGNDVNDRECLQAVGLPMVVQDAHPDVLPLARWRTLAAGGHGAVREVCDLFFHLHTQELAEQAA